MNKGIFTVQVNEVEKVLSRCNLLSERINSPAYNTIAAAGFRGLTYLETWRKCFDRGLYDFRMTDNSLLQFRVRGFDPPDFSYVYYECPYKVMITWEEFIEGERLARGEDIDEYTLLREYDLLVPELKEATIPLRYDYNPALYQQGGHPAAHIHFGHSNNVRIGTKKILRPLSFLLFVIRQCYPTTWIEIVTAEEAEVLCRNVSANLDSVKNEYWHAIDNWEMSLI